MERDLLKIERCHGHRSWIQHATTEINFRISLSRPQKPWTFLCISFQFSTIQIGFVFTKKRFQNMSEINSYKFEAENRKRNLNREMIPLYPPEDE